MSTTSHPPVPMAMGSGASTEEGRAFLQSRLSLYGRWVCLVSTGFLIVFGIMRLVTRMPFDLGMAAHILTTVAAGAIWGVASRPRLSLPAMRAVDAWGTWVVCACLALMVVGLARTMQAAGMSPAPVLYVDLLAAGYVLMARAIALPSEPLRTMWVSAAAIVPLVAADVIVLGQANLPAQPLVMTHVDLSTWKIAAVVMSTVASRVIFGLRAEVTQHRRLGQYTLDEKIGEGGMGIVYRAHHAMLRRPTAVKLLPPERAGEESVVRFEREVQLTAGLTHPNTVHIFDYGRTADGIFYYAMEYLDGINLDQLVTLDGAQPAGRVVRILSQVCGALAEAHGIGLVHRDVKPANIILCQRGGLPDVAKVVDFGLVKRFKTTGTEMTVAATAETTIIGTPLYMSPESVTGEGQVDARSDLYALGAVAYLLLTGAPVFEARTVLEVYAHHLHTPPESPSRRLGRPVPSELEALVLECLAKSPDDRPQSAHDVLQGLDRCGPYAGWSDAAAERWWERYRRSGTDATAAAGRRAPAVERAG